MNWTALQIEVFEEWEKTMLRLAIDEDHGICWAPPPKPANYDLWRQGDDPLNLASTKGVCCQGGGLVPETWTSKATPVRLPEQRLEQPNLL